MMKENDFIKHHHLKPQKPQGVMPASASCTLTIYIVMRILKNLRKEMGLEAMLEYIDKFIEKNENRHPQFPQAFSLAMSKQKLETIYENTVKYQKSSDDMD